MLFQKAKLGDITPTEDYSQEKSDTKSAKVQGFIRYLSYGSFHEKGSRFCKKSLKLYLWIKQMKNSILINIRWRPQVLGYIRDINKKSFMSLVTFTFWGLQERDLWRVIWFSSSSSFVFVSQWVTDWFNNGLRSIIDR